MAFDLGLIALTFAVFSGIFAYLAINMSKEHGILQIFFLFISMLLFGLDVTIMAQGAHDESAAGIESILTGGGISIFMWPFIFLLFYFIIYIMVKLVTRRLARNSDGWDSI